MHGKRSPTLAPMRAGSEVTSDYQISFARARKKSPSLNFISNVSQRFREALKDESDFKGSPFFSDNEIC